MRLFLAATTALLLVTGSSSSAEKKRQVSGLELQQIQARDFEVPKSVSFPAVMTVLQDAGYRIAAADKDTGLITGTASTQSHTTWLPFVGFGRSKKSPVVSAFIEDRGAGSRIRLNFVLAKTKSLMYGMSSSDDEPITDPAVYQGAFEKIEKEIFVRQSLNAPVSTAPTPAVTPASQQSPVAGSATQQPAPPESSPQPPSAPTPHSN
jgi:hypothetical protein